MLSSVFSTARPFTFSPQIKMWMGAGARAAHPRVCLTIEAFNASLLLRVAATVASRMSIAEGLFLPLQRVFGHATSSPKCNSAQTHNSSCTAFASITSSPPQTSPCDGSASGAVCTSRIPIEGSERTAPGPPPGAAEAVE